MNPGRLSQLRHAATGAGGGILGQGRQVLQAVHQRRRPPHRLRHVQRSRRQAGNVQDQGGHRRRQGVQGQRRIGHVGGPGEPRAGVLPEQGGLQGRPALGGRVGHRPGDHQPLLGERGNQALRTKERIPKRFGYSQNIAVNEKLYCIRMENGAGTLGDKSCRDELAFLCQYDCEDPYSTGGKIIHTPSQPYPDFITVSFQRTSRIFAQGLRRDTGTTLLGGRTSSTLTVQSLTPRRWLPAAVTAPPYPPSPARRTTSAPRSWQVCT